MSATERLAEIQEDWEAWRRSEQIELRDYVIMKRLVATVPALLAVVEAAARLRDCFGATGVVHGEPDRHFVEVTDTQAAIALIDAVDAFMEASDE